MIFIFRNIFLGFTIISWIFIITYIFKKPIKKIDNIICPLLNHLKIYFETIVMASLSIASIWVAISANRLVQVQIDLEKTQFELDNSPIFYISCLRDSNFNHIMCYYIPEYLKYDGSSLIMNLFSDFDIRLFEDKVLYDILDIEQSPSTYSKLMLLSNYFIESDAKKNFPLSNHNSQDIFVNNVDIYRNNGTLSSASIFYSSNEDVKYVLQSRFDDYFVNAKETFFIENKGANITNCSIYPFTVLTIKLKGETNNKLYYGIDDFFYTNNDIFLQNNSACFQSKSSYIIYDAIKYLRNELYSLNESKNYSNIYFNNYIWVEYFDIANNKHEHLYEIDEYTYGLINCDDLIPIFLEKIDFYSLFDFYNSEIQEQIVMDLNKIND